MTAQNKIRYLRIEQGAHNLFWTHPEIIDSIWEFFQRF